MSHDELEKEEEEHPEQRVADNLVQLEYPKCGEVSERKHLVEDLQIKGNDYIRILDFR